MRLDHLLSREIRVEVIGVISALMAPMVDRAIITPPRQVGCAGSPQGEHRIGRDLAKTPNRSIVRTAFPVTLQLLRVQPPVLDRVSTPESARPRRAFSSAG